MDIQTEKLNLIEWLTQLNNAAILKEIKAIKDKETDWWDDLSKEQKEDIEAGLLDLDHNRKSSLNTILSKYK